MTRDDKAHLPRRPNFLFVGPDKAGSTWICNALGQHPQVYLSPVKELFFFDRFYHKGWPWYTGYFKGAREQHRIVAEICHDYLFSSVACQRIARDLPDARLMICLREPSQRAFSEYLYRIKVGNLSCDFETALERADDLIDHGRYAMYLSRYLESFERKQIFVAIFDDLVVDPQRFFECLCDFLDIERVQLPDDLKEKVLPAARPRLPHLGRVIRSIGWKVRELGFPNIVAVLKGSTMLSRLLYSPFKLDEKPKMSSAAERYLKDVFSSDVRRVDALLGTDLFARWGYSDRGE